LRLDECFMSDPANPKDWVEKAEEDYQLIARLYANMQSLYCSLRAS
jgi:hypothetical protein